jgi:hypothetical protein
MKKPVDMDNLGVHPDAYVAPVEPAAPKISYNQKKQK